MFLSKQERRLRALRDVLPGQVLPGTDGAEYPLRKRIGEGSQGWVFRATWNGSIDVVVKVLRPDVAPQDSLSRFQREAQVLRMLSQQPRPNPHVVRFYDHAYANVHVPETGDTWTVPFTVMEFVDGSTLEDVLAAAQTPTPGGLGVTRARRILRHIALALRDVHAQGVVHRDLKPSNILVTHAGEREIAKVTDFGLAKLIEGTGHHTTAFAGATVGYAPPEQFEHGNKRVGRHTDVFSVAAIFYELVTGAPAFPFSELENPIFVLRRILDEARPALARALDRLPPELAQRPDLVAAVDAELARALSPEPEARHAGVMELFEALDRALSSIVATSSIPRGRSDVVLGPSAAPPSGGQPHEMSAAPTLLADPGSLLQPPVVRLSSPDLSPDSQALEWRTVTQPLGPMTFRAIAAASGRAALAVGGGVVARWDGRKWTSLPLPAIVDAARLRLVAPLGDDKVVVAGDGPLIVTFSPVGAYTTTRFEGHGLSFNAVLVEPNGAMVLAGERVVDGHASGVLGQILARPGGTLAPRVIDVPQCGPLRALTRLDGAILACGEAGSVAIMPHGGPPRSARICDVTLHALVALGDGTAAAVGGGGFAFRVWPNLNAQLEPIQTTRDLFALARAPDGSTWCGGAGCRVLKREPGLWRRLGAPIKTEGAAVLALYASDARALAFCDDGAVLDGRRR